MPSFLTLKSLIALIIVYFQSYFLNYFFFSQSSFFKSFSKQAFLEFSDIFAAFLYGWSLTLKSFDYEYEIISQYTTTSSAQPGEV